MNGSSGDYVPGLSLGQRSSGSNSDIMIMSPQFGLNNGSHQGELANMHMTMATLSMSLETLGLDMSLEEAVQKVRDLTKENAELRENVQQTNITMKQQYQILTDWKQKWEEEREQVRQKHEQARTVVTNLREEIKKKDNEIHKMELELIQHEEKANHAAPSMKAEMMSLEQTRNQLEKQCVDYKRQLSALNDEIQMLKNMREDQCNENDKYLKIVSEKEDKISCLERANTVLTQEMAEVQKVRDLNEKLEEQKQRLVTENKRLLQQLQQPGSSEDVDQGVADLSMQSGFVHLNAEDQGSVVSDSVPFTDPQPAQQQTAPPPSNPERVQCAAMPVYPTKESSEKLKQEDEQEMGEVILKLQDEICGLQGQIQLKNQEMAALHRKVHSTEELLADREHTLNVKLTQQKLESEQREEVLRRQLEETSRNMRHSSSTGKASLESQGFQSEEDARALRIQVTSLVSELQGANEKIKSLDELCHRHKQRAQSLEASLKLLNEQMEVQRGRDDGMIETLRVTISKLENQLSADRKKWQSKEAASDRLSREYAMLFQQYQEVGQQNDSFKKELQQRMTMSMAEDTSRIYQDRIDNLTAQLITAEESMEVVKQENSKLKNQLQQMGGEIDMVEILKAQAEVYRSDFEAERASREKLHAEKEILKEENIQLHQINQQIQEELNHVSENQIAEMQRRHGQSSITNQFRNMFGNGARNNPPGGDYTYADGVRPEATALATEQVPPPLPARDHQQQQQHSPRQEPVEDPLDPQLVCPMCGEPSPDIDTLQLHVIDCIR